MVDPLKLQTPLSPDAYRTVADIQANLNRTINTSALDSYLRSLAQVQEQYARVLASPAFEAMQGISRRVAAIAIPDFTVSIRQALDALGRSIRPMLDQFAESFERLRPRLESLARYPYAMTFFGWPPLDDLHMSDVYWVVRQYDARSDAAAPEVDRRVIGAYPNDRIAGMRSAWEKTTLLARQAPILRDALQAHLEGKYNLSVPVFLLCVESVAVTLDKPKKGHFGKPQREALVAATFNEDSQRGDLERATVRASASLFNEMLYGSWWHGDPIPPYLNRHAVLHGGDLEYGDEANSLRAMLLLDLLEQQYQYFSLLDSPVFHRSGCPRVRRLTSRARHYLSDAAAALDGRRPCQTCMKGK